MDSMLTVEHSQPYPHEDGTMGGEYSDYVYDEDHKFRDLIAAEIDAVTLLLGNRDRELDSLRKQLDSYRVKFKAKFDELKDTVAQLSARCDTLSAYCASADRALVAAAAERDMAQAQNAGLAEKAKEWDNYCESQAQRWQP